MDNIFYSTYNNNSLLTDRQCLHPNNLLPNLILLLLLLSLTLLSISAVSTLISPFSALSIESHREEEAIESRALKVLKRGEFLLDDEVYISALQVVKKR